MRKYVGLSATICLAVSICNGCSQESTANNSTDDVWPGDQLEQEFLAHTFTCAGSDSLFVSVPSQSTEADFPKCAAPETIAVYEINEFGFEYAGISDPAAPDSDDSWRFNGHINFVEETSIRIRQANCNVAEQEYGDFSEWRNLGNPSFVGAATKMKSYWEIRQVAGTWQFPSSMGPPNFLSSTIGKEVHSSDRRELCIAIAD